ncbi:MAG: hypothetical protein ABW252_19495 [Polyangiales bacterium]
MRAALSLRAVLALAFALAAGACTDDDGAKALDFGDGGAPGPSTGLVDGGVAPAASAACVDRPPSAAPRAPSAGLPCELLPPGFVAPR